jgi:murein L,D-transpeptidase YcbB/YkuD
MGKVKFMLPNPLGIYLHDYPDKALFGRADRRLSAGCIRLSHARALALALVGRDPDVAGGSAEARVDLAAPVPVYITYFTVVPGRDGPRFLADVYGRDAVLMAGVADAGKRAA